MRGGPTNRRCGSGGQRPPACLQCLRECELSLALQDEPVGTLRQLDRGRSSLDCLFGVSAAARQVGFGEAAAHLPVDVVWRHRVARELDELAISVTVECTAERRLGCLAVAGEQRYPPFRVGCRREPVALAELLEPRTRRSHRRRGPLRVTAQREEQRQDPVGLGLHRTDVGIVACRRGRCGWSSGRRSRARGS